MSRPLPPLVVRVLFVLAPLLVLGGWLVARYEADRFAHHAVVADAKILGSDLGCLGAMGSSSSTPTGLGGAIVYQIEFPVAGGLHTTSVRRPCDVIPPDFGRGRGALWVEYDVDHPDRVRVVNDGTAAARARWLRELLITTVAAEGVYLLCRQRTPAGSPTPS